MLLRRSFRLRGFALLLAVLGLVLLFSSRRPARAQAGPPVLQFQMPAAEIAALNEAAHRHLDYVPNQVVVKFKDGVSLDGQQRALMALRSHPAASDLKWTGPVAVVTDPSQPDATILAAQLRGQPEVEYAEPNYLRHLTLTPNDPSFSSRQWNFQEIDLPRAWDISPGASSNIVVAVVDSGVTTTNSTFGVRTWSGTGFVNISVPFSVNPDLSSTRLVLPQDFVDGLGATVLDTLGHGTHVSSTIGEDTNNGLAEAGIAYKVKIMPVKVCASYWDLQFNMSAQGIPGRYPTSITSECEDTWVAAGIQYAADNGANVINLSLGGPDPSILEENAIKYAVSKGVFVVIAAGNSYEDSANAVQYPARFAQDINGAIAVGAVGRSLKRSYYSSTGSYVEVVAPGGDDRDGGTSGMIWQSTTAASDRDPLSILFPRFDRYQETPDEGTSMAAPHVAGIAALLMSRGITKPATIEALIKATARDLGAPGRDDEYGYGLIQPRAALLGFGFAQ